MSSANRPAPTSPAGHGPQLIAYADRLGGTITALTRVLRTHLDGAFDGVHLLPYFVRYDGADAGFDPEDHTRVDPRLGTWDDVAELARTHTVMTDVIVNHMSARSEQFRDVVARGRDSAHHDMFLTLESVFPAGATEHDLASIYRPRPGLPFSRLRLGGEHRLVWTTFTSEQVDLDLSSERSWAYLSTIIDNLTDAGVTMLRLDAVGYVGKQAGTDCFMTERTTDHLRRIVALAHARGALVLVEMHGHYLQQQAVAGDTDYVYDFALPPLVLHALLASDVAPLARWLEIRPANTVTVLDTHDGIGIVDVGTSELVPGVPGLLDEAQIDALVEAIHAASGGTSRLATGTAAANLDLYQVNSTFFDALGGDEERYVAARLIQLFVPGVPQVYYVGLFAGHNDLVLLDATGVGRDVNRHAYTEEDVEVELRRPVVQAVLAAIRLRARHPAFAGTFDTTVDGSTLILSWTHGPAKATVRVDVVAGRFEIEVSAPDGPMRADSVATLAESVRAGSMQ